ncbi:hypothetical protein Syun_009975 [Stephania yunnanensis]|uniref:Tail specific protease domain-containing protein n=1 Tax=Stephania yunnanensis TaxID=152371 RepID=A0AAP0KFK2_9MAGN
MAMQAVGMSFSKIVLLSGAAYTASIMATNGQLADIKRFRIRCGAEAMFADLSHFSVLSIQRVTELQDGSALFITIAKYLSPSRHDIDRVGITSDVQCTTAMQTSTRGLSSKDNEGTSSSLEADFCIMVAEHELEMQESKGSTSRKHNLPPSPPGALPIIGHLRLVLSATEPFHRTLQALSSSSTQYEDYMLFKLGVRNVVVLSSPHAVEECIHKNDVAFANRPHSIAFDYYSYNYTQISMSDYDPHWRNLRRFTTANIFSSTSLHASSDVRHDAVRCLLRDLYKSTNNIGAPRKIDLKLKFFELTFNSTMSMLTGSLLGMGCAILKRIIGFSMFFEALRRRSCSWLRETIFRSSTILMCLRGCPGDGLAMHTITLALGSVLRCFEWEKIGDEPIDMSEGVQFLLPKAKALEALCKPTSEMLSVLCKI